MNHFEQDLNDYMKAFYDLLGKPVTSLEELQVVWGKREAILKKYSIVERDAKGHFLPKDKQL